MDTSRAIIHSDCDAFYASVEQAEHPELRGLPVIVGGDEEARHGIVLTASYEAKRRGVRTAMCLWEARQACPEAIVVRPDFPLYHRYSRMARRIYYDYTDLVEPFGLDEAWLDVSGSAHLFGGDVGLIAREISERVKAELGISVSVGISWNKVFAKLASDARKPDGYLAIRPETAERIVWPRPVGDLLYVGPATTRKLGRLGIRTIGQLAQADSVTIRRHLGKMGLVTQAFARGGDESPVRPLEPGSCDISRQVKSVGNGITLPFDATDERTVRQVAWLMGESVCQRMRALGLQARCVSAYARDAGDLSCRSRQLTLARPSDLTSEICQAAARLLTEGADFASAPVRALGVRASSLVPAPEWVQLDLAGVEERRCRLREADAAIDELRRRFGNHAVRRGIELADGRLAGLDPERDNVTHPISFFA
jgi:DNA polymerase-4